MIDIYEDVAHEDEEEHAVCDNWLKLIIEILPLHLTFSQFLIRVFFLFLEYCLFLSCTEAL